MNRFYGSKPAEIFIIKEKSYFPSMYSMCKIDRIRDLGLNCSTFELIPGAVFFALLRLRLNIELSFRKNLSARLLDKLCTFYVFFQANNEIVHGWQILLEGNGVSMDTITHLLKYLK